MIKKPFPEIERGTQLLELVHYDICEFSVQLIRASKEYFITVIDDYSRFTDVYLIRIRDEAFNKVFYNVYR